MDETGAKKDEVTEEKSEDLCKEHTDNECKEYTEKSKEVAFLDKFQKKDNVTSIFDRIADKKTEIIENESKKNELNKSDIKISDKKTQQVI